MIQTCSTLSIFLVLGNIVTAGLRLYFLRFKPFLRLAIIAHLWLLIPIYGWAKFSAFSALLAQQSLRDLVQSSEEMASQQQVRKRGWSVLITNLLIIVMVGLVVLLAVILIAYFIALITAFAQTIFSVSLPKLDSANLFAEPMALAIVLGEYLFVLVTALWVYARYFVVELPLILECGYKPMQAIKRCRNLTKGSTLFILGVIVLVFALTCPLSYLMTNVFGFRLLRIVLNALHLNFSTRQVVGYSSLAIFNLFMNAITMPFWQATKAALYYSLRSRREGFDLQLHSCDRS